MGYSYLVLRRDLGGGTAQELPVIFPSELPHAFVAEAITERFMALSVSATPSISIVSAGAIQLEAESCGGRSSSLGISSRESDRDTINGHPYMHGFVTLEEAEEVNGY